MIQTSEPGVLECCGVAVDPTLERVEGDEVHAHWHCPVCEAHEENLVGFIYTEFIAGRDKETATACTS